MVGVGKPCAIHGILMVASRSWLKSSGNTVVNEGLTENRIGQCCKLASRLYTPFTQLLQTRVCFTNAGINTYGAEIHKVRKHAIHAFPSFLFLILLFRFYVKEPFSEIMERKNNRLV